jgi:O-antigen/teichoic acid export membrane protein
LAFGLAITLLDALVAVPMTLTQARLESLRFVLTNLVMSIARLGLNVFFIAGLHCGIWGIFYAQAIVMGVSIIYLTYRELRLGSLSPDTVKWREILRFCLPLVPTGIIAFIYNASGWFAIIYIGPYGGEEAAYWAFGLYALAGRLMQVSAVMGTKPMQQVWTVEMYDLYKESNASSLFGNFALRLLCVHTFAVLFISLFALEIVRIMCGSSYYAATSLIPLWGLWTLLATFCQQMNNTFFITRKTNYNFFCNLSALPFIFLFLYLLVPHWGVTGAIVALCFANIFYAGFLYFFTQRFFYVRYPFGKLAMLFVITLFCYGLSLLCGSGVEEFTTLSKGEKIMNLWSHIQWFSFIAKLGIMFLWGVLIWFSGILSQEDKALILRVVQRGLQRLHMR